MQFVFDTSVMVDYLHDDDVDADALAVASQQGVVFVSLITLMELYLPEVEDVDNRKEDSQRSRYRTKSKAEVERDVEKILSLKCALGVRFVPCSKRVQDWALDILKNFRSPLGKHALADSLIIATGITRRAWLVTGDKKWDKIAQDNQKRGALSVNLQVISPVELVQRF